MNRNSYVDDDDDYYRKRDRGSRDYESGHSSRRRRSRSRSRDNFRESNDEDSSWSSSNRFYNNRDRDRDRKSNRGYRDRRDYGRNDRRESFRPNRHNESDDNASDGGNNYSSEPNNKVIVRGLAQHITEADIQCDLIQCNLKPLSIRLIRRKSTGASRGFAFVTFSSIDDAKSWIQMKQGVLILQDQYRAILQYSFTKDNDGQYDKVQTDWYCGKCGVFNFKRRDNCFKCTASREESGSEGYDEISSILTKKIMLRNLDALTTEEKVVIALQEKVPELVSKIKTILICRDSYTKLSRGLCYLYFDNLVDSMNMYQALEKLESLKIDGREVSFSYCVDSENRVITKPQSSNSNGSSNRREFSATSMPASTDVQPPQSYHYSLEDVPKLAEQAASMYAQNSAEKESYLKYYTDFYTNQIITSPAFEANSGASIANRAIERKQKQNRETISPVDTPNGLIDGKKYPPPDISQMQLDESGYLFDKTTNLYFDSASNYFFNSEIGQYLYWSASNSTYVLAINDYPHASRKDEHQTTAPPPPEEPKKEEEQTKKQKNPQDKVKVAKNIVKDMEKWAKKLNSKKDYTPVVQQTARPEISSKSDVVSDICFSMLEKKDHPSTSTVLSTVPHIAYPHFDSDDNEEQEPEKEKTTDIEKSCNEKDLVDFGTLTCLLCKRAFQSAEMLSKHTKQSNLHKENLQKYKLQNGILDIDSSNGGSSSFGGQGYRDRAKERRQKYGEADPLPVNRAKERYQREIEKKTSLAQTYQAQTLASRPIDDSNKGSKLLKAMGWREGSGLGKSGQGRIEIIEAEKRILGAGLGSKNSSYGAGPGDDYKSYIKKMMKKRYEEVN